MKFSRYLDRYEPSSPRENVMRRVRPYPEFSAGNTSEFFPEPGVYFHGSTLRSILIPFMYSSPKIYNQASIPD